MKSDEETLAIRLEMKNKRKLSSVDCFVFCFRPEQMEKLGSHLQRGRRQRKEQVREEHGMKGSALSIKGMCVHIKCPGGGASRWGGEGVCEPVAHGRSQSWSHNLEESARR